MKKIFSFLSAKKADNSEDTSKLVFGIDKQKIPSWEQLKYLPQVLEGKEKIVWQVCIGLIIAALIFIAGAFYFLNTEVAPQHGGEYTEGLVGYPEYVNPILAQANDVDLDLSSLIFSSLFTYNTDQKLEPDLITNYTLSDDEKTYTFYLRSDVKWHDDEMLDVDDVIFTIQTIQDKEYKSPLRTSLKGVQIERLDDHSFSLTLNEPFAPFLSTLTFGVMPEHRWYDIPAQNMGLAEDNLKPIGSGPFKFSSLVKDKAGIVKSYHLVSNEEYYNQVPYLDKMNFIFYPDMYMALEAAEQKKIEGISFIPAESKESLGYKNKKLNFYSLRLPQYTAIFINQKHSDVLAEDDVREALAWGVDRDRIINDIFRGDGQSIYTPILPGYVGHNPEVEKYGFDIEEGKKILEEAGWTVPEGEVVRKDGEDLLEFTIATVEQPEYLQALEILKADWEAMGFKINVDIYAVEDIQNQIIKPREYESLLFGEIVGNDPDPYPFWHSSQMTAPGLALSVFHQKDIDSLLEEARKITDEEERRLKYLHFQNILAEELPAIFLFNPRYAYGVHDKIKGISSQYITMPADRFIGVEQWHVKTQRNWKKKEEGAAVENQEQTEASETEEETTEEAATPEEETTEETTEEEDTATETTADETSTEETTSE